MAEKHLTKARDCVKKKNFEYAVHWYLTHLKAEPGDLEARKELRAAERAQKKMGGGGGLFAGLKTKAMEAKAASIRVNTKDPEKTMIQCEEVLKSDPDLIPALLRLGEAASHANLNDVAVQAFEDALAVDKKHTEALRLLGRVYKGTEQLDKALKCFQRLAKLDPKDKEAEEMCKNIPAAMTAQKVKEGVDKGGFQNLIDKDEAAKLERATQRIRTPEQALERIAELEPELEDNPGDAKLIKQIAELYVKANQPQDALKYLEQAMEAEPDNVSISEMRGDIMMDRNAKVLKKVEAAYKKGPSEELKEKLRRAQIQKLKFEIEEYGRRVKSKPTEYGLRFRLGKALFDANKTDDAIEHLQQAKKDPRRKSEASYYLGRCFINKKILKMAVRELDAAREDRLEMDDLKKEITYYLARIYEQANKGDKALSEYEQIAEVDFNYRDVTQRMEKLSSI